MPDHGAQLDQWLEDHWVSPGGNSSGSSGAGPRLPAPGEPAPQSEGCKAFINPVYKYIFLRNTKVAGTSINDALGGTCGGDVPVTSAGMAATVRRRRRSPSFMVGRLRAQAACVPTMSEHFVR